MKIEVEIGEIGFPSGSRVEDWKGLEYRQVHNGEWYFETICGKWFRWRGQPSPSWYLVAVPADMPKKIKVKAMLAVNNDGTARVYFDQLVKVMGFAGRDLAAEMFPGLVWTTGCRSFSLVEVEVDAVAPETEP